MTGIIDHPSPAPTAQDGALAERLVALAEEALSGPTEQGLILVGSRIQLSVVPRGTQPAGDLP